MTDRSGSHVLPKRPCPVRAGGAAAGGQTELRANTGGQGLKESLWVFLKTKVRTWLFTLKEKKAPSKMYNTVRSQLYIKTVHP